MNALLLAKLILSFIDVSTELSKGTAEEINFTPETIILVKQAQQVQVTEADVGQGKNALVQGFTASVTKLNNGTLISEHMKNF